MSQPLPQDLPTTPERGDDPALAQTIRRDTAHGTPADQPGPSAHADAATAEAGKAPGRAFGPYRLVQELGRGGMGVVWKAWDDRLGRFVALKQVLGAERPALVERFAREAHAAARLKHAHIVAVHDVGEVDGQHYFTTDYIEGESFDRALGRGLPMRHAVGLVRTVAEALAYAHGQGVIHRDVKPANILVDRAGQAYVMDFGLAKEVDSGAGLTVSGDLLGTPAYMSPEQARGQSGLQGPPGDQFSLGAVLYEALTARRPFDGASLQELLNAVTDRDPVRPSAINARVHPDLDTVCLKALEKEPSRRYPSMAEFALDLGRYLDGEPVSARRATRAERAWRRIRRSPVVSGLAAALIVAACTTGGVWWKGEADRLAARTERERLNAQWLAELSRSGSAVVDAALAWRAAGDLEKSRACAADLDAPIAALKANARDLAEPYFYKGRLLRALQRNAEAEAEQDEAVRLAAAPAAPTSSRAILSRALYERAVLRVLRYWTYRGEQRAELVRMQAVGRRPEDPPPKAPTTQEVEEAFPEVLLARQRAAKDLREAIRHAAGGSTIAAEGMLAVIEGRREAQELLARALSADRHAVELYATLAGLAEARRDYAEAAGWYEQGHEADRGYVPHLLGLAEELASAADEAESDPNGARGLLARGIKALEDALELDDRCAEAWVSRAYLLWMDGEVLTASGRDEEAQAAYEEALRAAGKGRSLQPRLAAGASNQARVTMALGRMKERRGEDPTPEFRRALAGYDEVLSLDPGSATAANCGASVYLALGELKRHRGEDPTAEYEEALARYGNALAIHPRSAAAATNVAFLYRKRAEARLDRGEDPTMELEKSLSWCAKALSINPLYVQALYAEACVHDMLGDAKRLRGEDPSTENRKAAEGYELALALNPRDGDATDSRALLHASLGDAKLARGEDPTEEYKRALEGHERALSMNPRDACAAIGMALVCKSLGDWKREHGEAVTTDYERALAMCEKALSINPRSAEAVYNQAYLYKAMGDAKRSGGEDPMAEYEKALARYDDALSIHPGLADAAYGRGCVYELLGDEKRARGDDPAAVYRKAMAEYERALSIRPKFAEAAYNRALIVSAFADAKGERGEDPASDYAKALAGYEEALSINPRLPEALYSLACVECLASVGKVGPNATARAIAPDEAARLRERAMEYLVRAVDAGWNDRAHMEADADLAPLHDDPRWMDLLARQRR